MNEKQRKQVTELKLQTAKKQQKPSVSFLQSKDDQFFLINSRQQEHQINNQLSHLPKDIKISQIQTMYDSYNLLKYGSVLINSKRKSVIINPTKQTDGQKLQQQKRKHSQSVANKSTKQKAKQLSEMRTRLSKIEESRKTLINQIGKIVIGPKKASDM